jgi:DNA invertase Pin-like site-specific DNA recombinase
LGQSAALYCRVSTADQTCARQERDLKAFAKKAGCKIVGVWKETGPGAKDDRAARKKILALAQAREIDVVLVTELTRVKADRFAPKVLRIRSSISSSLTVRHNVSCEAAHPTLSSDQILEGR